MLFAQDYTFSLSEETKFQVLVSTCSSKGILCSFINSPNELHLKSLDSVI